MRVVLVGFGTLGDLQPLVALGDGLRRTGHQVLFCGRPDALRWLDLRGLDFYPVPSVMQHGQAALPWVVRLHRLAKAEAQPQFDALRAAARGANLIVSGGSQLAVSSVAEVLGIRHRSVVYCPQMFPSQRHPPMTVSWSGAPRWVRRIGRRYFMGIYNRTVHSAVTACRRRAGLPARHDEFTANFLTHPLLACDSELAPAPPDCQLAFDQVGYLHLPDDVESLPDSLKAFLDAGRPPVYIGFGSTTPLPPTALTRLIVDAVRLAGCRAVVSSGWAGIGGTAPTSIYFAGAVSHAELFPHVAAIVHHGGAGTTASAARSGKPQMILPARLYDKAFWRAQVVDRGIGIWAPAPKNLTVPRFASLLNRVMSDSETAQRANVLGHTLRRRDAVTAAVQVLERCE